MEKVYLEDLGFVKTESEDSVVWTRDLERIFFYLNEKRYFLMLGYCGSMVDVRLHKAINSEVDRLGW